MSELKLVDRKDVEEKYTWDISLIYKDSEEFRNVLEQQKLKLKKFKESYENISFDLDTFDIAIREFEEIIEESNKLSHYAFLPMTVDRFNTVSIENESFYNTYRTLEAANLSFFTSKLYTLSDNFLDDFVANKRSDLKYYFEKVKNNKKHILSKEAESVLATLGSLPDFYNLYEITKFEDMNFDSFEVDGKTRENSYVLYENLYEMDRNKDVRRKAAESFYKTLNNYKNTTANEYISHIKKEKAIATMRGFDSVIDYLLNQQDGNRELYDRQIKTLMSDLAPHIRKYIKLLSREHNISDMTFADCKIDLDPDYEVDMSIDESREYLKKSLAVLGEDYLKLIDESYDKRWTDFPQNKGKSTGGFCATVPNIASYILLSWTGKMNEVFVLAHEIGHAYHFMSTGKHQTMLNFDCPLYFVEAPSTCNEVIVSNYLLSSSQDARFKRWVISNMISRTYFHNMVTHYLEAVYQDRVYKKVDNDEFLNADVLSQIKKDVLTEFFGDSLEINDGAGLTWMRQPHYYMGLYPYTYSAGLTIGTAVANKIDKDNSLASKWLYTLSKGSSMSALELAKLGGCDVSTEEPLKEAISYVGYLVDELYRLTDEIKEGTK
ncbi:oligoendopeptidase F [Gemella sp. GH3]|uniref:oligoendopeptidase F n=1 Tax=unclassified Gemella TaxID=2624949 RepID=UPI0015CF9F5A|nr:MULTISPECIES: oligoendopeptidase F [unclassified Gemella]MBF0713656.1 oligoendopeptidase F [Gemella sp. GH3.1]NYS50608.1 oligoendopeptidase F [Gemella sp. GH3]